MTQGQTGLVVVAPQGLVAPDILSAIDQRITFACWNAATLDRGLPETAAVLFDITAAGWETLEAVAQWHRATDPVKPRRLFLVRAERLEQRLGALRLGAHALLTRPLSQRQLTEALHPYREHGLTPEQRAIMDAGQEMMRRVEAFGAGAGSLSPADLSEGTRMICAGVAEMGLDAWMNTMHRHHNGTYQHCLLVTGIAVSFAQALGFRAADVETVAMSGLLHDVGKSRIPLNVLDKPGSLTNDEMAVMRTHARLGADILAENGTFSDAIVDVAAHHHEALDGSGYPDGLRGAEISDLVRMMTICDVFGALVEARAYKPAMSRTDACAILTGMAGKLDMALVRAFGDVIARTQAPLSTGPQRVAPA